MRRAALTDDYDVISDIVSAVSVGDVTGVDPVVLLCDRGDLQGAVLQPAEPGNPVTGGCERGAERQHHDSGHNIPVYVCTYVPSVMYLPSLHSELSHRYV